MPLPGSWHRHLHPHRPQQWALACLASLPRSPSHRPLAALRPLNLLLPRVLCQPAASGPPAWPSAHRAVLVSFAPTQAMRFSRWRRPLVSRSRGCLACEWSRG